MQYNKDRRLARHGKNFINTSESIGDFFSRPSIYETAVVVDFVSDPIDFLSEKINIVDLNSANIGSNKLTKNRNKIFKKIKEGKRREGLFNGSSESDEEDIIKNVSRLEAYTLESSSEKVENSDLVSVMPRNSIIGINISKGNIKSNSLEVFLPFFSSHLCLPVKPGEHVWCFYDNIGGKKIGYWISRKTALLPVEDVNYTHYDRNEGINEAVFTVKSNKVSQKDKNDRLKKIFTNFTNNMKNVDINSTTIKNRDYDDIIIGSKSYKDDFIGQAVPRYNKKCSDLILQGSNNTVIAMSHHSIHKGTITLAAGRPSNNSIQNNRSLKAKKYEYEEEDKSQDIITIENLTNLEETNTQKNIINNEIALAASYIRVSESGKIELSNRAGASIILEVNGDVVIKPGSRGLLKLGGDDAQQAVLGIEGFEASPGHILAPSIISTMGGAIGVPNSLPTGAFATKILVK